MYKAHIVGSIGILAAASIVCWCVLVERIKSSNHSAIAVGHSMVPTIFGAHYELQCPQCGIAFAVDSVEAKESMSCTHCDERILLEQARRRQGDSLPIETIRCEDLRYGDLVAVKDPLTPNRLLVKRLIGRPGDCVEIKQGELRINHKTPKELAIRP